MKKRIILFALIVALLIYAYYFLGNITKQETSTIQEKHIKIKSIEDEDFDYLKEEDINYTEIFDSNKAISSYYQGEIFFASNLVNLSFVQASDNDYFLRRDWKSNSYSELGSIFMDYSCQFDSQNIILYGHNVYASYYAGVDENGNRIDNNTLMFTPLKYLRSQDQYEDNKTVYLLLENELREYLIVSVYYSNCLQRDGYTVPEKGSYFYYANYSEDSFNTYKAYIKSHELYDTGVDFTIDDKYLTLQTCVEEDDLLREIVVCKLIDVKELKR